MFKNAKVGDKVYDILKGWTTITSIVKDSDYPIRVTNDDNTWVIFTLEGKRNKEDANPTLFWDEIKFEIPEKPFSLEDELRRLEVVEFNIENRNYYLYWDNCGENIECYNSYFDEFINYKFFSESSIKKFMDNVKDEKIIKEEFFKAYNIVFGGK